MNLLDGKRALVTGAEGRLGPVWIQALRNEGAAVHGVDIAAYDLRDRQACARLAEDFPDIDILVNNAGVDDRPDLRGEDQDDAMVAVNVLATKRLCHAYGHLMATRGGGVIVNIASLYGLVAPDLRYYDHRLDGWEKGSVYGATKAAVIALTRYYAAKHGAHGVRVNALAPGGVQAGDDSLTRGDAEFARKYRARIPMKRLCQAGELAGPLVFLASDMSSFVNGHTLPLDGGYLAW